MRNYRAVIVALLCAGGGAAHSATFEQQVLQIGQAASVMARQTRHDFLTHKAPAPAVHGQHERQAFSGLDVGFAVGMPAVPKYILMPMKVDGSGAAVSAGRLLAVAQAAPPSTASLATRTWVSGIGDDVNPCSRTAPCKTFAGSLTKTAADGEISVLDAGGYGSATVGKSITLNGAGTHASILAPGMDGIIIKAGPEDRVVLKYLHLQGARTGLSGITIVSAGTVIIENCIINNFSGAGVVVLGNARVILSGTTILNSGAGVVAESGRIVLDHVRVLGSRGDAVSAAGSAVVTGSDVSLSGNGGKGVSVSAAASVNLERCAASGNDGGPGNPNACRP